jgi:hypothetical protein
MVKQKGIEMYEEAEDITKVVTNVVMLEVETDEEALGIHNLHKGKFKKLKSQIVDDEYNEDIKDNKPRKVRKIKDDGTIEE